MKNKIKNAYRKLDKVDTFAIGITLGAGLVFAGHMYDMKNMSKAIRIADIQLYHDNVANTDFLIVLRESGAWQKFDFHFNK